ncbi:MAG TPA: hypothetical protein EYG79_03260, partial [Rhodobacteraceae bacterium]|nr:hypothetical protein [Paracoccaceae bacterium]
MLPAGGWAQSGGTAGHATQRIDGLAKVTGQKVFARDFSAADMGWQGAQWYALFARAISTSQVFSGLTLPSTITPTKVIYGDQLSELQRAPKLTGRRDLHLDSTSHFDQPES